MIVVSLLLLLALSVTARLVARAPEGWEDEDGWHAGRR